MGYVIDRQKRLRLPSFKPGETWNPTQQDENHILLEKLVPPPDVQAIKARLEKDVSGVLVLRGGPQTTVDDTRRALADFP